MRPQAHFRGCRPPVSLFHLIEGACGPTPDAETFPENALPQMFANHAYFLELKCVAPIAQTGFFGIRQQGKQLKLRFDQVCDYMRMHEEWAKTPHLPLKARGPRQTLRNVIQCGHAIIERDVFSAEGVHRDLLISGERLRCQCACCSKFPRIVPSRIDVLPGARTACGTHGKYA